MTLRSALGNGMDDTMEFLTCMLGMQLCLAFE